MNEESVKISAKSAKMKLGFLHHMERLLWSLPARSMDMDAACYLKLKRLLVLCAMFPRVPKMKKP